MPVVSCSLAVMDAIFAVRDIQRQQGGALRRERIFRDRQNPFEYYDDIDFRNRFRFTKPAAMVIIEMLRDEVQHPTARNHAVPAHLQILAVLRFFATGSFQIVVGDVTGLSQPTMCRFIKKVSIALARKRQRFIRFPSTPATRNHVQQGFYDVAQFPNIVSAIDGSHIAIENPGGPNAQRFINRKGQFSLNTQFMCDAEGSITNVVARWPGSAHDSRIFYESRIKEQFENNELQGIILGDSGYPCLPYLMTPLLRPETRGEVRYNTAHKRTRNCIERMFGRMKRRFPSLHFPLRLKLETSFAVIVAIAVLHNIALLHNEPEFDEDIEDEDDEDDAEDPPFHANAAGNAVRRNIIHTYFD